MFFFFYIRDSFDIVYYKHSSFCTSFLDIDNKFLFSLFKGEKTAGINVRRGCITNILEENVVQPVLVCTTAITQATETVRAILKIDDIVQCRQLRLSPSRVFVADKREKDLFIEPKKSVNRLRRTISETTLDLPCLTWLLWILLFFHDFARNISHLSLHVCVKENDKKISLLDNLRTLGSRLVCFCDGS